MTPAEQQVADDMAAAEAAGNPRRLAAARQVLDGLARVAEALDRASRELDREIAAVREDLARRAVEIVREPEPEPELEPLRVGSCFEDRAFQLRWRGQVLAHELERGHARRTQPYFGGSSSC